MKPPIPLLDLPSKTAARLVGLGLLEEGEEAAARFAATADGEALHDLRVALRRLRSAIRAFRAELDDTVRRRHRQRLRALLDETGEGRDRWVELAWLERLLAEDPGARAGCEPLREELEMGSGTELAALANRVRRRFPRVHRRLRARLGRYAVKVDPSGPAPETAGRALGSALRRAAGEARERMAALAPPISTEAAHRARIAVKRVRYLLEPFAGEIAGGAEAVGRLKELQTALGDLHDLDLLAARVAARPAESDAEGEALRRVALRLRERREESEAAITRSGPESAVAVVDRIAEELGGPGADTEIERKFLLDGLPEIPEGAEVLEVEQGWFGTRLPERVRRTRSGAGERHYRAIKHGAGMRRLEVEEEIPAALFAGLWPLTQGRRVRKRRYRVRDGELRWEIDEFLDRDLVLAEVEIPSPDHPSEPPAWLRPRVVREVTQETEYLNVNMAR